MSKATDAADRVIERFRKKSGGKKSAARPAVAPRDWYAYVSNRVGAMLAKASSADGAFGRLAFISGVRPVNGATGKFYTGVLNNMMLGMAMPPDSRDPRFMTFAQAVKQGWHVRAGESSPGHVLFYKRWEVRGKQGEPAQDGEEAVARVIPLLRGHAVFHSSQIEGIPVAPVESDSVDAHEAVQQMLDAVCATGVRHVISDTAFPVFDFDSSTLTTARDVAGMSEVELSALVHELVHASASALDRAAPVGVESRDREELVTEIASSMLRGRMGLKAVPEGMHDAELLPRWADMVAGDRRVIFRAMKGAQASTDWYFGRCPAFGVSQAEDVQFETGVFTADIGALFDPLEASCDGGMQQLADLFGDDAEDVFSELGDLFATPAAAVSMRA